MIRRPLPGRSPYSLPRLIEHALDGVFFQTTVLLRWIVYLGFFLAGGGGLLAAYFLIARVAARLIPGWTSIVVVTLVLSGFIILSTGITGLYIGRSSSSPGAAGVRDRHASPKASSRRGGSLRRAGGRRLLRSDEWPSVGRSGAAARGAAAA